MKALWELCFAENPIRIGLILPTICIHNFVQLKTIRKQTKEISHYNWLYLKINIPDIRLTPPWSSHIILLIHYYALLVYFKIKLLSTCDCNILYADTYGITCVLLLFWNTQQWIFFGHRYCLCFFFFFCLFFVFLWSCTACQCPFQNRTWLTSLCCLKIITWPGHCQSISWDDHGLWLLFPFIPI